MGDSEKTGSKILRGKSEGSQLRGLIWIIEQNEWMSLGENLQCILNSERKTITIPTSNSVCKILEASFSEYQK